MNAVDTNVLVYVHDPRDPVKQNKAVALIVAACMDNGIQTLYSEDFDSSTTRLTGVKIVNPF